MATYEFKCKKCGVFEVNQPMGEKHEATCPGCGSEKTDRVFCVPGVKVISDKDIVARRMGVPKKRLEESQRLRDERVQRKKDPSSQMDLDSNELHVPKKKSK